MCDGEIWFISLSWQCFGKVNEAFESWREHHFQKSYRRNGTRIQYSQKHKCMAEQSCNGGMLKSVFRVNCVCGWRIES